MANEGRTIKATEKQKKEKKKFKKTFEGFKEED